MTLVTLGMVLDESVGDVFDTTRPFAITCKREPSEEETKGIRRWADRVGLKRNIVDVRVDDGKWLVVLRPEK